MPASRIVYDLKLPNRIDFAPAHTTTARVEAIAATCFEWLEAPMASAGGTLLRVRLWETEKTSAIYPG